jgi:hypothetical protein
VTPRSAGTPILAPMDSPEQRKAWVCQEVAALLRKDIPLAFALSTVQSMANTYCRGLDAEYGPFLNVERIWELHLLASQAERCVECGHYGEVITHAGDTFTPPDTAPCPRGCP